jgi:S1-C subfamily serine protease
MRLSSLSFLCLLSAGLGAIGASVWWNFPASSRKVQAQENLRVVEAPQRSDLRLSFPERPDRPAEQNRGPVPIAASRTVDNADELTAEERVNVAVYEACNRSVVNINTTMTGTNIFLLETVSEGAGSGSVLDQRGNILTNYHVIEGARDIEVTLYDGKSYPAKLVGRDASTDIAVLKIEAPPDTLFPVRFGDSTKLKVGQRVFALGNPFGLDRTLTTGIVSSLNRSLPARNNRTIKSIIQIDAAINPGNSGGPLLDSHARLIGMNTAIASKTGQNTGVGFAIPASVVSRVVPELIQNGKVTRPETGILQVHQTEKGLQIATMAPKGPAEQAGLRGFKVVKERKRQGPFVYDSQTVDRSSADMITAVNGQPTTTADDFLSVIDGFHPGDEVTITVIRDGRETPIKMRLTAGDS